MKPHENIMRKYKKKIKIKKTSHESKGTCNNLNFRREVHIIFLYPPFWSAQSIGTNFICYEPCAKSENL